MFAPVVLRSVLAMALSALSYADHKVMGTRGAKRQGFITVYATICPPLRC